MQYCFRIWLPLLCGLICVVSGCGERDRSVVPVSGVVKLDDKPLAGAIVAFVPMMQEGYAVGVASKGETDANGHFSLTTTDDRSGALVGEHSVRISTFKGRPIKGSESVDVVTPEKVPARYNNDTQLHFKVPEQGTDKADFDLKP